MIFFSFAIIITLLLFSTYKLLEVSLHAIVADTVFMLFLDHNLDFFNFLEEFFVLGLKSCDVVGVVMGARVGLLKHRDY